MKKILLVVLLAAVCSVAYPQSAEMQQLILNIEKLTAFKKILQQLYDGYKILEAGYGSIRDLSKGNFQLHKSFLDGLLEVSPAVRKYYRIAEIIAWQQRLVKEYKTAFLAFRRSGQFSVEELKYMADVFKRLASVSLRSVDELAMVITAGKLRMSDEERLHAIDNIYRNVMEQYSFLHSFNRSNNSLRFQREKEKMDIDRARRLHQLR